MSRKLPKIFTILFILFIILQTFSFLFLNLFYLPALAEADWKIPELQISIPTLDLTDPKPCPPPNQDKMCVPWIGQYIAGVYRYAIGIVGILATVVMMVGGIMWIVAGGNAARIGEAKAWIGASLTGLVLALSSYMILYQINPKLTQFEPIKVTVVKDKCGGCPKNTECVNIHLTPGLQMKGAIKYNYQCLSTLPGNCTYMLSAIHKESKKTITLSSETFNTKNEEECWNIVVKDFKTLINDPTLKNYTMYLSDYSYTPK